MHGLPHASKKVERQLTPTPTSPRSVYIYYKRIDHERKMLKAVKTWQARLGKTVETWQDSQDLSGKIAISKHEGLDKFNGLKLGSLRMM